MALLASLRSRPWLGACIVIVVAAIWGLTRSQFGHLLFWAGIAGLTAGLLMALTGEVAYRRERASHREP